MAIPDTMRETGWQRQLKFFKTMDENLTLGRLRSRERRREGVR